MTATPTVESLLAERVEAFNSHARATTKIGMTNLATSCAMSGTRAKLRPHDGEAAKQGAASSKPTNRPTKLDRYQR